jgi:hypothetical protein
MHHHWKEWREKAVEVFNSRLTYEQRRAIEKMKRTGEYNLEVEARQISQIMAELFSDKFEISEQIDRQLLIPYLKKAGRTLFVSGSLIPISGLFGEIFEAQTVRISRHSPIKDKTEIANTEQLQIKCMDGGIADVDFHKNDVEQTFALLQRLNQLRESNRMGLIIMPTIEKAQELARLLEKNQIDCEIVSGEEEWKQTGALEKVTKKGAPGKIIISTLIAHRDIDLKIPREVEENGGAEVIVVGLPPNERALWQSLQRVLRGDIPGTRRLMLSREDFQTIFNRIVLQDIHFVTSPIWETLGGQRKLHENHIKKMHKLWRGAVFHHSLDAKRELFKECLSYLRYEEFRYKRQLTFLFMRDEKLDEWKQEFIERMEKILPKKLDATPSDILIQLIPYLPPNSPNLEAQMNSLTRMQQYPSLINSWAMFLEDMEHEFNTTFLTDLENRKFPLDVVKKRWQNFIGRRLNQLDKNPD